MNEKILIVDDEKSIVDLIQMELEFEGYEINTAFDGEEALRALEHENRDREREPRFAHENPFPADGIAGTGSGFLVF